MKFVPVTVSFALEGEYGDHVFRESFQDSQDALAYIGGYLGAANAKLKGFTVEFHWDK